MFGQLVDVALISKCQDIHFPVDLFLCLSAQALLHIKPEFHRMDVFALSSPLLPSQETTIQWFI